MNPIDCMRSAIDFVRENEKADFPDDYEDVNKILTGLALLTQMPSADPNSIKVAIEAAFRLGWQRRAMIDVDASIWLED